MALRTPYIRPLAIAALVALSSAPATAAPDRAAAAVVPAPAVTGEPVPEDRPSELAAPPPAAAPAARSVPVGSTVADDGVFVRRRVPRSIGVWLGWGWNAVNYLPLREDGAKAKPHGASFLFDYGWQVGGLRPRGWPSYVGFLAGTTFYPGAGDRRNALTIEYGLLVRHHLAPQWKVHPFLAYGLGAIQAFVFGVEGRGIGHLTRLSVGLEGKVSPKVRLALELIYKIDPIRAFRIDKAMDSPKFDIHTVSAMFGVNFTL